VSTSQSFPAISVTNAIFVIGRPEPGKNAIAHGASKRVTSLTVNGRPEDLCALLEGAAPQPANTRKRAAWIDFAFIRHSPNRIMNRN
jgi:hypothetical protein